MQQNTTSNTSSNEWIMFALLPMFPANHQQHLQLGNHLSDHLEGEPLRPFAGGRVLLHRRHGGEHARRQMVRLPSSRPPKFGLSKATEIFLATTCEKAPTEEEKEEENCKG